MLIEDSDSEFMAGGVDVGDLALRVVSEVVGGLKRMSSIIYTPLYVGS